MTKSVNNISEKGLFNFRDVAELTTSFGQKIRPGQLFRTGNISQVNAEIGQQLKTKNKISTYIDFRTESEIKHFGKPEALLASGIEWINLHIHTDDRIFLNNKRPEVKDWVGLYSRLFDNNIDQWVKFLNIVADAEQAVVYGCLFGKDRTGIATSFLLTTLDVHEESIIHDFSHTTKNMHPHFTDRFNSFFENTALSTSEVFHHYLTAHPEIMDQFIDHMMAQDEHILNALERAGFDEKQREKLKKKLIV